MPGDSTDWSRRGPGREMFSSSPTEASITPVNPPIKNVKKKPSTKRNGGSQRGRDPQSVAIQQKI